MPGQHPHRLREPEYCGRRQYSLTISTFERAAVFHDDETVNVVRSQILRASSLQGFVVSAYCFMPDHLHLFVSAQAEESNALRFIALAKQLSGFWYKSRFHRQLWQRSTWDRVVRSGDTPRILMRYVLLNPVRAGLVSAAMDYPFSGSEVYGREDLIELCRDGWMCRFARRGDVERAAGLKPSGSTNEPPRACGAAGQACGAAGL